jgi:hypothetical protein
VIRNSYFTILQFIKITVYIVNVVIWICSWFSAKWKLIKHVIVH